MLYILTGIVGAIVVGVTGVVLYGADGLAQHPWVERTFWALISAGVVLNALDIVRCQLCKWFKVGESLCGAQDLESRV